MPEDETAYLQSTEKNKERLADAIERMNNGEFELHKLIEE